MKSTAVLTFLFVIFIVMTDAELSWTENTASPTKNWAGIAMSADGTKLSATVYGGKIWNSVDSGSVWTEVTSVPTNYWA